MKPIKSARKSVPGRPFEAGFDARRGRGPRRGAPNAGRPPDAFKNFLAQLRDNPDLHDALKAAACDSNSRGFASAWKIITAYDPEKPAQRISIDRDRIKSMTDEELQAIVAGKR